MKSAFLLYILLILSGLAYGQKNETPSIKRILIQRGEKMKEVLALDETQYVHLIQLLNAYQASTDSVGINLSSDHRKAALILIEHNFHATLRMFLKEGQWNTFLEDEKRKRNLQRQRMQEMNIPYNELDPGGLSQ